MSSHSFHKIRKYIGFILVGASLPLLLVGYVFSTARFQAYGQARTVEAWRQAEAQFDSVFGVFVTGVFLIAVGGLILLCQMLAALWRRATTSKT